MFLTLLITGAIIFCSSECGYASVEKFITMGIDVSSTDQASKNAALMKAIESGNLVAVKALVAYGADVNATVKRSGSVEICPVLLALRNSEILEFLIVAGADINVKFGEKKTLLHIAAQNEDTFESLAVLLKNGANVNATDLYGKTPLHLSIMLYSQENTFTLLEYGANIHALDHERWKPLHRAYKRYNLDLLKKMIELGASLNEFTPDGTNALHEICNVSWHAFYGDDSKKINLIKFLVENQKMDVNQHSNWIDGTTGGFTPFMLAVGAHSGEDFQILEYFLDKGADMNTKIFRILHDGRINVIYHSVLDWVVKNKRPYHVIEWLQQQQ